MGPTARKHQPCIQEACGFHVAAYYARTHEAVEIDFKDG